jgi:hypothetical protein
VKHVGFRTPLDTAPPLDLDPGLVEVDERGAYWRPLTFSTRCSMGGRLPSLLHPSWIASSRLLRDEGVKFGFTP